jgi:hypothetical protein
MVFVILSQTGNGYIQTQLVFDHAANNLHLTLTTIGENKIG